MTNLIEPAPTNRSKCRGCGKPIDRGELRFGERLPNPFGRGEVTLWFHLQCAAFKRPAPFLETLDVTPAPIPDRERLREGAERGVALRRLSRIDGAERATGARARCRHCHEMIVKGEWRIPLVYFEEGTFNRRGFVHVSCSRDYFETTDVLDRLKCFASELGEQDVEGLRGALGL
jgi:hypothetical protein